MVARLVEGKEALLGMIAWKCWLELLCVMTASLGLSLHMPRLVLYKVIISRLARSLYLSLNLSLYLLRSLSLSLSLSLSVSLCLSPHISSPDPVACHATVDRQSLFLSVHPSLLNMRMCVNKHTVTVLTSKLTNRLCLDIYMNQLHFLWSQAWLVLNSHLNSHMTTGNVSTSDNCS